MLELIERYRTQAHADLEVWEAEKSDLKAKQGELNARIHRLHTRLELLNQLKSELSTGESEATEQREK